MRNYIVILLLIIFFSSCKNEKRVNITEKKDDNISSNLQIDHFNIWVNNPEIARESLTELGFNSVPDSLSAVHEGQGTAGKYFNFLNGYLELIFVYDQNKLEENIKKIKI